MPPSMPEYSEDDFIQLSALQHYAHCPRQCALIHLDMAWSENVYTAEGRLLHAKADSGAVEIRGDVKTVTGLSLRSTRHGISGKADVVEFHRQDGSWRPFPVEYKRGRPKKQDSDRIQLCMQALCLEEMLSVSVPCGALFYGKTRRREEVLFTEELREKTTALARETHDLLRRIGLPPPADDERCRGCSLLDHCLPQLLPAGGRASRYLEGLLEQP
ncbi:MAG: CRISPR-associated protein Cas4 [Deltaproteobacteria bacterium]|jgi:CRISPR-associated exonuclease Cas4|nr:CRISPR-associated protein Cas4 [Deltaproteobacteria bacterium]